ncbi:DUF2339 domain-containing protein [Corynebacterium hindlerae]|uniref:DUF2339 domain-containing protein n=1 Tax=Corynebacterium hindlerae TaxID=699041 RepID=A0A7G5FF13_9CORY|nr:DUF2339 domain-containing protein [Corynebacterium hindlerae]QMV85204.1 DUF2339 domain-containing protein [Corynebacterium hindlerae]
MKLNDSDQERLRNIADKLNDAETALDDIRKDLFTMYESSQPEEEMNAPPVQPEPEPQLAPEPEPEPEPVALAVDKPAPVAKEAPPPFWQDEQFVIRAVAVGGVLITLAGVSLLIALAIQNGWLGPLGRVIGAWLIAALLLGGAVVVRRRGLAKEGLYALTTASLLTSSLTTMATVSMLGWWPPIVGASVLVVLLALFSSLARAWDDEMMLNITIVSGFIMFFLYLTSGDFFTFPVIAPALFIAVCSMQKRWTSSRNLAALIGPVAIPAALYQDGFPLSMTVIIGVAVFVSVALLDEWGDPSDLNLGFTSPMVMLGIGALLSESFLELTVMVATIAGFTILAVLFYNKYAVFPLTMLPLVYLLWWSRASALGAGVILERPTLVAVYFVVFSGLAWWISRHNNYNWYPWASMFGIGILLTSELGKAVLFKKPLWLTDHIALVQAIAILVFMVTIFLVRHAFQRYPIAAQVIIGIAGLHLSALVIVTVTTYLFSLLGENSMWLGYLVGHALVSISWMLLAAYILVVTNAFSRSTSLAVGLILAIASVVKLVFFDLGTLEGVPRVIAFLISGLALLAIASLRAKKTKSLNA